MLQHTKVCHLTSVHGLHDIRIYYKECYTLADAGYKVSLIVCSEVGEKNDNITIIPVKIPKNRLVRMTRTVFNILRLAIKEKADIYHFHDPELIPVGIILRFFRKKVIYDVHEDAPESIKRKDWLGNIIARRVVSFYIKIIEQFSTYFFNAVIAATPTIADKFNPQKTICIRNFPILRSFNLINYNRRKNNKPIIIYSGALSKDRGICEIIQAMSKISNKAELWLVGRWDTKEFEETCKSQKGWENIKYLGFVKPEKAFEYMMNADIGIVNFLPVENHINALPNKPFEYMACSLPIIMSNFPYWKDLFGKCAVFVDPKDPKEIAEKINELIDNKELRLALGKHSKELVQKYYSWEAESKKLINLYANL